METKKPLNFAQALRVKPPEKQPEMPVEKSPVETPVENVISLENWETSRPKTVDQSPTSGDRSSGRPVNQTTGRPVEKQSEHSYPSRRERLKIGVRLPAHKVEKYKLWCFVNKVDLQDAIEKGMDWVTGGLVDQSPSINNLIDIDDNLNNDVISFYEKWTRNKATEKDRKTYSEIQHLAPHVIKSGILVSVIRAKNKINSLKYCVGAIEEAAETNPSEDYLKYLLEAMKHKM
jgi:hypothetical protein